MTGVGRGVVPRPRWADLVDTDGGAGDDPTTLSLEELIEEADDICVSVRLDDGGSVYVAVQPRDTVGDLNLWIEKTQGLRCNSFALSRNGEHLTRRRPMATLAPACVLHLTSRVEDGRPRGMPLFRCNSRAKTKHAIYVSEKARGDHVEFPQATRALPPDARLQRLFSCSVWRGERASH